MNIRWSKVVAYSSNTVFSLYVNKIFRFTATFISFSIEYFYVANMKNCCYEQKKQ